MRTVKWNPFLSGVCTIVGGMLLWTGAARADVTSTNAAGLIVFPKLVLDTTSSTRKVDTIIQLSNTASNPVNVRCYYVNANGHCSNVPTTVCDPAASSTDTASRCGSDLVGCVPGWQETDFAFRLTSKQPIEWTVGEGLPNLPLSDTPALNGERNSGSIPQAPEDPMIGELKCVEVGDNEKPIVANDLKGEATIEEFATGTADSRGYNGIGIQAIRQNDPAIDPLDTLVLGDPTKVPTAEYNGCPNLLVLDHFFDDATEPSSRADTVRTDLTFVPCSEDFNQQLPLSTTVQFLVYNEFEQRLSSSRSVRCFAEIPLSDLPAGSKNGPTDDATSIFNVNVQGTLTGQTVIRAVGDLDPDHGHGLLAVAEEFHGTGTGTSFVRNRSAAYAVHQRGVRSQADFITLAPAQPEGP
jgi:hypothetical protein